MQTHNPSLPFVSIIVPVYNGAPTIGDCIEALLNQDYPKDRYEILVVDNNSKDDTAQIVKKFPIRYLLEDHIQTSYSARNLGIREAKGEIYAFTDSDCIADKNWLFEGVREFQDQNVGGVAGEISGDKPKNEVEQFLVDKNMLEQKSVYNDRFLPFAQTANVLYRKSVFDTVGLFEGGWVSGGDTDIAWRMQLETPLKLKYAPGCRVIHRHRSSLKSMYRQRITWAQGKVNLYKKYKNRIGKRHWKQTYWDYRYLFSLGWAWLIAKLQGREDSRKKYFEFIACVGTKYGHLKGSWKNRVFHI